jgi:putative component of membrane protein insertase Oxa1/YidC/SpoIIIJ protein YidD
MNKFYLILFLLNNLLVTAQTDGKRWEAKQVSYELTSSSITNDSLNTSNRHNSVISIVRDCYSFLISDLDGDNCPFTPSCSDFFVQAVEETNIFTGMLMFADRFTRDLNLFKVYSDYPVRLGKFYDPPDNYTLNLQKTK